MGGQLCRYRIITKLHITVQTFKLVFVWLLRKWAICGRELSRRKVDTRDLLTDIRFTHCSIVDNKLLNQWYDLIGKIHNYVAKRCKDICSKTHEHFIQSILNMQISSYSFNGICNQFLKRIFSKLDGAVFWRKR